MSELSIFENVYTRNFGDGHSFERYIANLLHHLGFAAELTGNDDRGVDIIAQADIGDKPKFYIQCKCHNNVIKADPMQEIYTGWALRGKDGYPVVIANNSITQGARAIASQLGIEVIGRPEWEELNLAYRKHKIFNKCRYGLMGMMLAASIQDQAHLQLSEQNLISPEPKQLVEQSPDIHLEHQKQIIKEKFDAALSCEQEAAQLDLKASQLRQMSLALQKEAALRNLDYG